MQAKTLSREAELEEIAANTKFLAQGHVFQLQSRLLEKAIKDEAAREQLEHSLHEAAVMRERSELQAKGYSNQLQAQALQAQQDAEQIAATLPRANDGF